MVLGYAGEGEMPVQDHHVYMPGLFLEGLERRRHEVHGVERETHRYPLKPFLETIREYRGCYTWITEGEKLVPRRVADETEIQQVFVRPNISGTDDAFPGRRRKLRIRIRLLKYDKIVHEKNFVAVEA